ncbi:Prophage antirepressor [Fontibacillus panacisegetis]|uniref:Prophage antirepressor n=1 Tax=Fontibacillus panacisegetis TaxID=670482 RepID=A0A1G7HVL0_9BACL|nr:Bro-N domain-containing protein [Fontibacillus panacisegetis]SDF04520.1 Prophage antirepressor [Fontibacillus panacisegetis]
MNKPQIFNNQIFGDLPVLIVEGTEWFGGTEAARSLSFSDPHKAIQNHVEEDDSTIHPVGVTTGKKTDGSDAVQTVQKKFINESGLYSLIFGAARQGNNPEIQAKAREFKQWVTSQILPTIRRTGGYVSNDDQFMETYLPFADEQTRSLFRSTLVTVRQQNELIKEQRAEIDHKENVIVGLVDDIDLAAKRQVLNRVVRKAGNDKVQLRWNELYRQFEMKYHLNLKSKLESYNESHKPKLKNKLDYIDKVMDKLPQLYEIACKIYEADVKELVAELYELQGAN